MEISTMLKHFNQEHLLQIIQKMDNEKQQKIIQELKTIDFEEINNLFLGLNQNNKQKDKFEPIQYIEKQNINGESEEKGIEIIKKNKYAVITLAGGQGSRLGYSGPKGTYMLDIKGTKKSIFELLSENLVNAKKEYDVDIPWYIMTSSRNDNSTKNFFKNNKNFGVNKVKFFTQMDIPVIDKNGKLLIGEDYLIKKAGNGNGGIYKALEKNGILRELEVNGIEWVFVSSVDNILANMVDPLFLGLNCLQNTQIAAKSTLKKDPYENAGVFCKRNGKYTIFEYIEMTKEMKELKDKNGKLVYGQVNIASHLFSLNALKKLKNINLEYHISNKKSAYINEDLKLVIPDKPNIYKFEQFIFDGFQEFDKMTILSIKREEEFAPVKNAIGDDSPDTAVNLYIKAKKI